MNHSDNQWPQSTPRLSRRHVLRALVAVAGAAVVAVSRRQGTYNEADFAAGHLVRSLGLDTNAALRRLMAPGSLATLEELIMSVSGLKPGEVLRATVPTLHNRVRTRIADDYLHGRIEQRYGWFISITEARGLELASRVQILK